MSVSDTLSLALCKIKNAQAVDKSTVTIPKTKLIKSVLDVLVEHGFIVDYSESKLSLYSIEVRLKRLSGLSLKLARVSKPSLRKYSQFDDIPRVMGGAALVIMSTSKGVMSGVDAKKCGVGGEVLCFAF